MSKVRFLKVKHQNSNYWIYTHARTTGIDTFSEGRKQTSIDKTSILGKPISE